MAIFVHLAPEKASAAIRRGGIKPHRHRIWPARGVYAMPVTPNYYISHQWLRELKRGGQRVIVGIYFRVSDNEVVVVGHYREHHQPFAADEAVGIILHAENPEGYEVVIHVRLKQRKSTVFDRCLKS